MRAKINIDTDSFNRKIEECKDLGYDIDKTLAEVKDSMEAQVITFTTGGLDGLNTKRIVTFVFD